MTYETILYELDENIATITLNRPDRLNAYNFEMFVELRDALQKTREDDEVRVLILTGAGRAFCAGADLKQDISYAGASTAAGRQLKETVQRLPGLFRGLGKPAIAAVNGPAMGFGCDLALMCDIRIAAETARFSETFVKLGVTPGAGGAYLLPRAVGLSKACELLFTGETVDGKEAERIGLASKVVPLGQLMGEARALARKIAANPPLAVRLVKQAIYVSQESSLDVALDYVALSEGPLTASEDFREAVQAFREKRPGQFKGR